MAENVGYNPDENLTSGHEKQADDHSYESEVSDSDYSDYTSDSENDSDTNGDSGEDGIEIVRRSKGQKRPFTASSSDEFEPKEKVFKSESVAGPSTSVSNRKFLNSASHTAVEELLRR